jgi:hypothetical protein
MCWTEHVDGIAVVSIDDQMVLKFIQSNVH